MERKPQHFIASSSAATNKKVVKDVSLRDSILSGGVGGKNSACFKTLDMRQYTIGPHTKVIYKGLTFYLDRNSEAIFQEGLKRNNQMFTIGTYEAIMNGPHVDLGHIKGIDKEGKELGMQAMLKKNREKIQDNSQQANVLGTYAPEILSLDYKVQRKEQRLIYVMPVTMNYEGKIYQLKTKDISIHGIKVLLPRTMIIPGKIVMISFDYFIKEQEEYADDSKKRFFKDVRYEIIDVEHTGDKTFISLIQRDLNDIAKTHIHQFINANRLQYKVDSEDALLAAQAKYIEHIYTHNLSSIPLFISEYEVDGQINYATEYILSTPKNKHLIDAFLIKEKPPSYDFSAFMLPHRLKYFSISAFKNKSHLMFVYQDNGQMFNVCDFELQDKNLFAELVFKVVHLKQGKIFSINSSVVNHPTKEYIKSITEHLLIHENHDKTQMLINAVKKYKTLLMLTDVTKAYKILDHNALTEHAGKTGVIKVWSGFTQFNMATTKPLAKTDMALVQKNITRKLKFDVQKTRYDTRYEHVMPVKLMVRDIEISAHTMDLSKNGIGVNFKYEANYQLAKNDVIKVSFPEFDKKIKDIDFKLVDFKVAGINFKDNQVILGLIRLTSQKNIKVGKFFEDLINKNKTKLSICANDLFELTINQILEAYLESNIISIPMVIKKDKEKGRIIKQVGLNQIPCPLTNHFVIKLRGYNFKLLTSQTRLKEIYTRSIRNESEKEQSFTLFMYKNVNEQGVEYINSYTSFNMTKEQIFALLPTLFEHNGVCIQLNFVNEMGANAHVIEQLIKQLSSISRHVASRFHHIMEEAIACVDMIDITNVYHYLNELELPKESTDSV
ncbi:MAG: PilZ domain-containing protein [Gammaproteobacteria bacterium]|nr:PilZ domain-containing protein [Gammaproteobacteria bacterium]